MLQARSYSTMKIGCVVLALWGWSGAVPDSAWGQRGSPGRGGAPGWSRGSDGPGHRDRGWGVVVGVPYDPAIWGGPQWSGGAGLGLWPPGPQFNYQYPGVWGDPRGGDPYYRSSTQVFVNPGYTVRQVYVTPGYEPVGPSGYWLPPPPGPGWHSGGGHWAPAYPPAVPPLGTVPAWPPGGVLPPVTGGYPLPHGNLAAPGGPGATGGGDWRPGMILPDGSVLLHIDPPQPSTRGQQERTPANSVQPEPLPPPRAAPH